MNDSTRNQYWIDGVAQEAEPTTPLERVVYNAIDAIERGGNCSGNELTLIETELRSAVAVAIRLASRESECVKQLQQLGDAQAAIINAKNDTIAQLRTQVADLEAALKHCQSHSYADDFDETEATR